MWRSEVFCLGAYLCFGKHEKSRRPAALQLLLSGGLHMTAGTIYQKHLTSMAAIDEEATCKNTGLCRKVDHWRGKSTRDTFNLMPACHVFLVWPIRIRYLGLNHNIYSSIFLKGGAQFLLGRCWFLHSCYLHYLHTQCARFWKDVCVLGRMFFYVCFPDIIIHSPYNYLTKCMGFKKIHFVYMPQ